MYLFIELSAVPERWLVQINGDNNGAPAQLTEATSTKSGTTCPIDDYNDSFENGFDSWFWIIGDFIFNKLIACGGGLPDFSYISRTCMYYDCIAPGKSTTDIIT